MAIKIKGCVCSCGNDTFFVDVDNKITERVQGVYCYECGKFLKWSSREDRNLWIIHSTIRNEQAITGEAYE